MLYIISVPLIYTLFYEVLLVYILLVTISYMYIDITGTSPMDIYGSMVQSLALKVYWFGTYVTWSTHHYYVKLSIYMVSADDVDTF